MHYPIIVINIMEMLSTLPKDEFFSGFSESVKGAVIFDTGFFHKLERYGDKKDFSYKNPELMSIMNHSAYLKMINSQMPVSHKIKLLYGHAIGHGYEIMGKDHIRHGDAVAIGMTIEGALACLLKLWNIKQLQAQTKLLKALHLPVMPKSYNNKLVDILLERMTHYKKLVTKDTYAFVFPVSIGKVADGNGTFLTHVPRKDLRSLLFKAFRLVKEL